MTLTYKIIDTDELVRMSEHADDQGFGQKLEPDMIPKLDPNGMHLIRAAVHASHKDPENPDHEVPIYRCIIMGMQADSNDPLTIMLEMTEGDYNSLKNYEDVYDMPEEEE